MFKPNMLAKCMEGSGSERKCSKEFPKDLKQHTLISNDCFAQYKRRSPDKGGESFKNIK